MITHLLIEKVLTWENRGVKFFYCLLAFKTIVELKILIRTTQILCRPIKHIVFSFVPWTFININIYKRFYICSFNHSTFTNVKMEFPNKRCVVFYMCEFYIYKSHFYIHA